MRKLAILFLALSVTLAFQGCKKQPETSTAPSQPAIGEKHTTTGVIKKFGEGNKTLVIEHAAFADGFMEAMTMSFELESPKMAAGFKAGDKVEFTLEYKGSAFPIVVM